MGYLPRIMSFAIVPVLLGMSRAIARAQVWPDSTIVRWQDSVLRAHNTDRIGMDDILSPREQYEFYQHYDNSPENNRRPSNAVLHRDTVLLQSIWVDREFSSSLICLEDPRAAMIVPPFKINGRPYYRWLLRRVFAYNASLPSWIIPDSTLLRITWWCYHTPGDSSFCWPVTDEIETIKGDPHHLRERLRREYPPTSDSSK